MSELHMMCSKNMKKKSLQVASPLERQYRYCHVELNSIDLLVRRRRNSNSNILELRLICTKTQPVAIPESDYRQVSNIRRNLVSNKIVDHSDVVGASPVGAAPTTSSFST